MLLSLEAATSELKLTLLLVPAGKQKELSDAWQKGQAGAVYSE